MPRTYTTPTGITLHFARALGSGQFGIANEVRTRKGDSYCLKEIPVKVSDEVAKQQALTEVKLMKETCNHDNIVTFYESWFERNRLCILMEFAPNGSLDKLIEKCAKTRTYLTSKKVAHFVEELASALDYCHNTLKIIHRDIKPANILVDELGTLKLTDFGMSKSLGPTNDLAMTFCGSPLYMAPEQLHTNNTYSFPADMWAMGCVVYEIMTLSSPWVQGSEPHGFPALVQRIMYTTPSYSSISERYSVRFADMTRWLLQRKIGKRATALDIVSLLEMRAPPTPLADTIYQPNVVVPHPPPPVDVSDATVTPRPTTTDTFVCRRDIVDVSDATVTPRPTTTDTLSRRRDIVDDARRLVEAATSIQRSYRLSQQMRRHIAPPRPAVEEEVQRLNLFERQRNNNAERRQVGPKPRVATRAPVPRTPVPQSRVVPTAPTTPTNDDKKAAVIQRALRSSLNRRVTRRAPSSPMITPTTTPRQRGGNGSSPTSSLIDPSKCSARLEALAQPRPQSGKRPVVLPAMKNRPFRTGTGATPMLSPRPAWC